MRCALNDNLASPGSIKWQCHIRESLLLIVGLALAVLYRFGADRAKPRWRWITWGSAFATVSWLAVSMLFSYYAAHFGSYNKTYGSLGAVIGFMTWIWLSTIVFLIGAEIDSVLERRTTGRARPAQNQGRVFAPNAATGTSRD